jgi:hypothetical protein
MAKQSLAERIRQTCAEADAYIDQRAAAIKATPDGQNQPLPVLRQMLTRGSGCACRVALHLMEQKQ